MYIYIYIYELFKTKHYIITLASFEHSSNDELNFIELFIIYSRIFDWTVLFLSFFVVVAYICI